MIIDLQDAAKDWEPLINVVFLVGGLLTAIPTWFLGRSRGRKKEREAAEQRAAAARKAQTSAAQEARKQAQRVTAIRTKSNGSRIAVANGSPRGIHDVRLHLVCENVVGGRWVYNAALEPSYLAPGQTAQERMDDLGERAEQRGWRDGGQQMGHVADRVSLALSFTDDDGTIWYRSTDGALMALLPETPNPIALDFTP